MFLLSESLKLTRNSENYFYLKCSNRIRQIDIINFQSEYQSIKVMDKSNIYYFTVI